MDILTLSIDVAMAAVAWVVQGILYPAFREVSDDRFPSYHAWYTRRITWYVGPLMVGQVVMYAYQVTTPESGVFQIAAAIGVLLTWGITGLGAVPVHSRLSREGFDDGLVDRLIRVNLARTLVWTAIALMWIPRLAA